MRLAVGGVAALLLPSLFAGAARAEECRRGEVADLDVPRDGATVPPNVRFRVFLYESCGGFQGSPPHRFRLLDAQGADEPFATLRWATVFVELAPDRPLPPGRHRLEVQRPIDERTLGPWEKLTQIEVAGDPDLLSPELAGLVGGEAKAIWGDVRLSPCQAIPGWELSSRLTFPAARDKERPHDDLLYLLERQSPGSSTWEHVTTFRPTPAGDAMSFAWKSEDGWGETFTYRLHARDPSGNEAIGPGMVTLTSPARPEASVQAPEEVPGQRVSVRQGGCACRAGGGEDAPGALQVFALLTAIGYRSTRARRRRLPSGA